ncbi:MAG: histidinol-phosphate transaminase [Actinomycetia bacterium]|nr:histidinol-phosphate transaminase [Actinomycetes bacterium]MCP4957638.1 histidinol-phosphate transaminase [Actinomycetes bacterium]
MTDKNQLVRPDLRALEGYHSPQLDVEVRLNTNEAPTPPPDAFGDELAQAITSIEWHRYPDRQATDLRQSIADMHGVDPSQVMVANGSNEVLQTICLTFGGAGRTVATFEPTYAMHGQIARTVQCDVVEGERNDRFELEAGELSRVISESRPAITFLCSPNNPTGTPESLENIELALNEAPGVVVVDEAYGQFAAFTALDLLAKSGGAGSDLPLLVTRTFSKTWSMAGARLGYVIGPAWMITEMENVLLPYHLDTAKQLAGTIALKYRTEMNARVAAIMEERGRISHALSDLGFQVWPSQANFLLFRTTPTGRGGDDVWQALVERSVLVRNCSSWPRLDGCLRVTVGSPDDNDRFLDALADLMEARS